MASTYPLKVHVIAMIEPIPADNTGGGDRRVEEISVEAESYEEGVSELPGQVPEGWRIINLRRAD
jgi:hypothetical protein